MRNCGFNIFEGCNCGGHCKSATIPLGRFTKAENRTLRTVSAKENASAFSRYLKVAGMTLAILALLSIPFVKQAIPYSKRQALLQQENISHVVRR